MSLAQLHQCCGITASKRGWAGISNLGSTSPIKVDLLNWRTVSWCRRHGSNVNDPKPQYISLKDANAQMQKYHETRELMRQGKLAKLNNKNQQNNSATAAQAGILVVFLIAFMSTPFIGKKIAQDEEFRKKYVPSWYDYTVKRPENAWTRDELHEQMLQVQHDIHTRAIAGEFTPEKLKELQDAMQSPNSSSSVALDELYHPHRHGIDRSKIPKEWDMVHPGLAAGEDLDERDS
jgi:hypothetical protein